MHFVSNIDAGNRILVVIAGVEKVNRVAISVHERDFAALEISIFKAFSSFKSDIGLLARYQIAASELVERGAAAGRWSLHGDIFNDVWSTVVVDNTARFHVFGKHGKF